ncbi:MAG: D-alanine--D-alanine ligase [Calditrichaeota bacterium]|nr:D-alanine--D-alanine ligase [Calditrichota bacterium]MCB9391122.1 D-alanine--D-alanine ligase [Calditrichota bacterium]
MVSLASGDAVAAWCAALGHETYKYDPERPGEIFSWDEKLAPVAIGLEAPAVHGTAEFDPRVARGLLEVIEKLNVDVVFPILHGGYGEDGTLQSLLEWTGVSYTGSGPRSSAICMHKPTAKALMKEAGVPLAQGIAFNLEELSRVKRVGERITSELGYPSILKPQGGGSTVGLTVLESERDVAGAVQLIVEQHDGAIAETFFKGKEIAATVVNGESLPLVEIRPKVGIYDYSNKYTSGRTEYICPAELPAQMTFAVRMSAETVFRILGARGFARIDYLVNDEGIVCLELNSLPGMTALSLVPKAAHAHGWSSEDLIARILDTAWRPVGNPVVL